MGAQPVGRIPFDEAVADSTALGVPLVEMDHSPAAAAVEQVWERLAQA
jgi:hypothetical protein